MSLELRKTDRRSPEYKEMRRLYKAAFPPAERAPFFLLAAKARHKNVDWLGIYEDGCWAGFFYVITSGDLAYLFYFAVSEAERGRGCGRRALEALKRKYKEKRLFLAVEALEKEEENYPDRVRRKRLYLNCGFEDLKLKLKEGEVVYEMLGLGGRVTAAEYKALISSWTGPLLGRLIDMRVLAPAE
ncbi:MAG: GNAT family N-acetyltransferase [Oscillospiraceae bacterium]|nr:GNAT family N-acetyltransferase [Oscillospiraceae bacterium]